MADDGPIDGIRRQRPALAGVEMGLHRVGRAGAFDAERGDRAASRRGELDHVKRCRVGKHDRLPGAGHSYALPR